MSIVEISKYQILAAIKDEPLRAGRWVQFVGGELTDSCDVDSPFCRVCAVGAVMRSVLDPDQHYAAIDDAAIVATGGTQVTPTRYLLSDIRQEAIDLLAEDRPMNALSVYFEGVWSCQKRDEFGYVDVARVRDLVRQFVEECFPNTVIVDIGNTLPAEDAAIADE